MAELTSVILLTRAAAAANRNAYKANPSTNHATASPMSPVAIAGTPILSVTRTATASGVASTISCARVTVPTAITVPTSTWLGRRMASSTSEMRVDFSIATVVAIAVPASISAIYRTMPTATPTPTRPTLSTGPATTCLGGRIDSRSATCRGLSPALDSCSEVSSVTTACATTPGQVPADAAEVYRVPPASPAVASPSRTALRTPASSRRDTYVTVKPAGLPAASSVATTAAGALPMVARVYVVPWAPRICGMVTAAMDRSS